MSKNHNAPMRTLTQQCIQRCQDTLAQRGYQAIVHFELEGVAEATNRQPIDYENINRWLTAKNIPGALKAEYWPGQWEYVSRLAGQSPLEEAQYLSRVIQLIPPLLQRQGASKVYIQPVVWHGAAHRYAPGSKSIFGPNTGSAHIPNAIQINVSLWDANGTNLMPDTGFGEWLQYQLLCTSRSCCLLFLPEEAAFSRLLLRTHFGLEAELSSPSDLSGGHRGSIALYKRTGKHGQPMGLTPLIVDTRHQALVHRDHWRDACRVEHRLGATSAHYDFFINVLFVLLNILDALDWWRRNAPPPCFTAQRLPKSLYGVDGAIELFRRDAWMADALNRHCPDITNPPVTSHFSIGHVLKHHILKKYLSHNADFTEEIACTHSKPY